MIIIYSLYIDTHYTEVCIVLFKDGKEIDREIVRSTMKHSVVTMPSIQKIIDQSNNRSNNRSNEKKNTYLINLMREKSRKNSNQQLHYNIENKRLNQIYERYRRDSNMDSSDFKMIKNQEIANALNNSCKYKEKTPASINLERRTRYGEIVYRNLRLKNRFSKSEKNINYNVFRPRFNLNPNNKNHILFNTNKYMEDYFRRTKIKQYSSRNENCFKTNLIPLMNENLYSYRNSNININRNNNINPFLLNQLSNVNYSEFPAIDSYFH